MSLSIKFMPKPGLEMQIEATSQVDAITQMASLGEIFGIRQCGACKSEDIRWQIRTVANKDPKKKPFEYIELVCNKCRARLSFGRFQDNPDSVFPKKKDADGNWLENNGWVVFKKESKEESKDEGAGF